MDRFRPDQGLSGWVAWLRPAAAVATGLLVVVGASLAIAALPPALISISGNTNPVLCRQLEQRAVVVEPGRRLWCWRPDQPGRHVVGFVVADLQHSLGICERVAERVAVADQRIAQRLADADLALTIAEPVERFVQQLNDAERLADVRAHQPGVRTGDAVGS